MPYCPLRNAVLTREPVRSATQAALAWAKDAGALISFDPNLRPPLWDSLETAREQISWGLARCEVKIAGNELEFMTGETDFDKGAAILQKQYPNIRLLNVTAGPFHTFPAEFLVLLAEFPVLQQPRSPSLSHRKPAKRLRREKRRNSQQSGVFAAHGGNRTVLGIPELVRPNGFEPAAFRVGVF